METLKTKNIIIGLFSILAIFVVFFFVYYHGNSYYNLYANFNNVSGLKIGDNVAISGAKVGKVTKILLSSSGKVKIKMNINNDIKIPDDSQILVSIPLNLSSGMFLEIFPGISDNYLKNNNVFVYTQGPINYIDLIFKFFFNK